MEQEPVKAIEVAGGTVVIGACVGAMSWLTARLHGADWPLAVAAGVALAVVFGGIYAALSRRLPVVKATLWGAAAVSVLLSAAQQDELLRTTAGLRDNLGVLARDTVQLRRTVAKQEDTIRGLESAADERHVAEQSQARAAAAEIAFVDSMGKLEKEAGPLRALCCSLDRPADLVQRFDAWRDRSVAILEEADPEFYLKPYPGIEPDGCTGRSDLGWQIDYIVEALKQNVKRREAFYLTHRR